MKSFRNVILSAAKNLTARPFTEFILSEAEGFRVTTLYANLMGSNLVWVLTAAGSQRLLIQAVPVST